MESKDRSRSLLLGLGLGVSLLGVPSCGDQAQQVDDDAAVEDGPDGAVLAPDGMPTLPRYEEDGALVRVAEEQWRRWVFLGTGLNLSYAASQMAGADILSTVYMEPTAYAYYQEAGEFREGTMTALAIYAAGSSEPPLEAGLFADELLAFEMSVKDSDRLSDEVWGYYSFNGSSTQAEPRPPELCHQCHADHAQTDFVFTQFYPSLP